jgi:hypothetical protein
MSCPGCFDEADWLARVVNQVDAQSGFTRSTANPAFEPIVALRVEREALALPDNRAAPGLSMQTTLALMSLRCANSPSCQRVPTWN